MIPTSEIPFARIAVSAQYVMYKDKNVISNWCNEQSFIYKKFYSNNGTFALLAWGKDKTLIAFRGTDQLRDWLANVDARKLDLPHGQYVHNGFHDSMQEVGDELAKDFYRNRTGRDVILAGHSKGAVEATAFAFQHLKGIHTVHLHTCGSPRYGNAAFRDEFSNWFPDTYRWNNNSDAVPHVPPALPTAMRYVAKLWRWFSKIDPGGYRHVGKVLWWDVCGKLRFSPTLGEQWKDIVMGWIDHIGTQGLASVMDHSAEHYFELFQKQFPERAQQPRAVASGQR